MNGDLPEDSHLRRYRDIIPEWSRFVAASTTAPPDVLRTNTLYVTGEELQTRLERRGVALRSLPWEDLFSTSESGLGRSLEHWLGWFYLQEATQTLPVVALDPRPGEAVLDLCAAPGGKTSQIAARMENCGLLVANEPSGRRHPALLANLNRLGVLNCTVTAYRGESFPGRERFDRILVDAPCSAEGTLRKDPSMRTGATPKTIERLARLQRRLLIRAFDLLRPGGVLVYSTCTFAPEENEAAVAALLEARDAAVEPVVLPVRGAPGITTWDDSSYPDDVSRCVRIYPHHIDSGGGFVARVVRRGA
ncbi:MAG: NOL1/NOP2/sun family putative RNA methylase [Candidatus Bipolaricaulota bacterium]|nr:MAG: NOL1/NOP2/sun family putative RNA methylase [Candidatus Bipolaricaulota bacterium]